MTYALVLLAATLTTQVDPAPEGLVPATPTPTTEVSAPARAPEGEAPVPAPADAPVAATPQVAPAPTSPPAVTASLAAPRAEKHLNRFGLMIDAGVPDFFGASIAVRPLPQLRVHGGIITTTAAFGLRGGVAYVPFQYWVTPSATLEVGRMFEGSTAFLRNFGLGSATQFTDSIMQRFSYTFVNGHAGLEFGSSQWFSFYLKAGLSYVDMELVDFEERFRAASGDPNLTARPARIHYSGPSAKLGFLFYFL